jgi:hypothetical protein
VVDAGGIAAVLSAMHAHPASAAVAEHACATLCIIAVGSEALRQAVVDAGGVAAVVSAMRAHPASLAVANAVSLLNAL